MGHGYDNRANVLIFARRSLKRKQVHQHSPPALIPGALGHQVVIFLEEKHVTS